MILLDNRIRIDSKERVKGTYNIVIQTADCYRYVPYPFSKRFFCCSQNTRQKNVVVIGFEEHQTP